MENSLRANPLDIREQYEKQPKDLQEACGEAMLELRPQQKLLAEGAMVPLAKLWARFGVPRRTVCCKPTKAAPKVDPRFAEPIKAMIEKEPSFGYSTVAWLLGFNKNTAQRIFQIKGWQVRKRPVGMRLRIEAVPSVAAAPNECWSTGLCLVWAGRDGWTTLALVIDCHTRALPGWHLPRSGKATTAASALEHALINRVGALGRVYQEFLPRPGNGLVFTSRKSTVLPRSYGLKQEFITPHCPQQNGMIERLIRTLKEQRIHRQRFDGIQHATRAMDNWVSFYNTRRPHQSLDMQTPAAAIH
ncbi:transposase [Plastorhodobacter daqingensis]|uniref:Transposase n=1 Tax=Plastorhodobacter daqingensis TaxID=1387281 RepID=A0ABW2UN32_9RHOB